ncbi:MAG: ribonuclease J [Thermodesulfobacteriota bacterium]
MRGKAVRAPMDGDSVRLIPLGGLGEIGLNCLALECRGRVLVIDAGSMFPEDHMLGVDLVIPDFHYLRERADKIVGIVLTHGHEDHIGALPFLLPQFPRVTLYGTPMTLGLVREKLWEHRLDPMPEMAEVRPRQALRLGPFGLEFLRVCHSITDGLGLAIKTPAGLVVHSGDFKFDPSPVGEEPLDIQGFGRFGGQGVRLLLSDSTNVEHAGFSLSEREIQRNLEEIFRTCTGRIIFTTFSSNIQRIRGVIELAERFGRRICIIGRSMCVAARLAGELGYLTVRRGMVLDASEIPGTPKERLLVLTTGSQGEPLSALSLMAMGTHKWLKVERGDTVIFSSRFIPGNEKAIYAIINALSKGGARVIYEPLARVHVSGHASREELKLMIHLVRPEYFIPIHGEHRHLVQHVELAHEVGVAPGKAWVVENGEVVTIARDKLVRDGRVETGRIYVDGKGVGDVGETLLRDRQHLSEDGVVVALVVVNKGTGEVVSGPDLFSRGFALEGEETRIAEARQVLLEAIQATRQCPNGEPQDDLKFQLRKALKSHFWRSFRRRPMIMPIIVEV